MTRQRPGWTHAGSIDAPRAALAGRLRKRRAPGQRSGDAVTSRAGVRHAAAAGTHRHAATQSAAGTLFPDIH
jgi:hypothetical protein